MSTLVKISVAQYLEQEAQAEQKSEYHSGDIIAMAGASEKHNTLVSNLVFLINRCIWDRDCKVYANDLLLKLESCDKYVYPDVMLVCGEPQLEHRHGVDTLLNPTVVIEVLSKSTQNYDMNEKMQCYFELISLQQYILVDSKQQYVQNYQKTDAGDWLMKIAKAEPDKIKIQDCEISLADIYRKVGFETKA
ncbi:MAG: Uma2 family endonuclease [Bernardetiaceae bacterium]|nr:Uma2 family endonuclease [Bernardetiaceae bacterium]